MDTGDLNTALFHPAMSAGGAGVCGRDIFPGQRLELTEQAGLVSLDSKQLVGLMLEHHVVGVASLCV